MEKVFLYFYYGNLNESFVIAPQFYYSGNPINKYLHHKNDYTQNTYNIFCKAAKKKHV